MRRLLLHGPAIESSRRKLIELKQKFGPNNAVVYEEGTDWQIIKTALFSQSLFADQRSIILENPPADLNFDGSVLLPVNPEHSRRIDFLNLNDSSALILWFDHEVDVKKWPGFEQLFFPEAKEISVFPFLDCIAFRKQRAFLEMEKLKAGGFDIFYLLTMAFYLLRSLAVVPKKAPQFVKDKLQRQRRDFPQKKITDLYKQLLEIDFKLKSGLLEKPQAEFLLVNKFLCS